MNALKLKFDTIDWPIEFIVEFKNGEEQIFSSAKGVQWNNGNDLEGENENRANIYCCWKKKSPSQHNYKMIEFFVDEVKTFKTTSGKVIWQPIA